jgi:hypothetical protein
MFKYELGQKIYYLMDNRLHSAPVLSRIIVENQKEDYDSIFKQFGNARILYATCHGEIDEKDAFASKEELADNLIK